MDQTIIKWLIVSFLSISALCFVAYSVFFFVCKFYFRQIKTLAKKYNDLITNLHSINIHQLEVLAANDVGDKFAIRQSISTYKLINENSKVINTNITTVNNELQLFHIKQVAQSLEKIKWDINKANDDLTKLSQAYKSYTQYGTTIQEMFQNYLIVFEYLKSFALKIKFVSDFKDVNKLIIETDKNLKTIPKLSIEFDYKKTTNTLIDLSNKIKNLAKILIVLYRFQMVYDYLTKTKTNNDNVLISAKKDIDPSDYADLKKMIIIFNQNYSKFVTNFKNMNLDVSKRYALEATKILNKINQVIYVSVKTPTFINITVKELKKETNDIVSNKNKILESINRIQNIFDIDPKISSNFNDIKANIEDIVNISNYLNKISFKTHTEKVRALKDLYNFEQIALKKKADISNSLKTINDSAYLAIKSINDLNNTQIYLIQLLAFIKKYSLNNNENNKIQESIKLSLEKLDKISNEISSNKKCDFDKIAFDLAGIIEDSKLYYSEIVNLLVLKNYCNRMIIYTNRYKKFTDLNNDFEQVKKLYKQNNFEQCLDTLISIAKKAKKMKKNKKQ